MPRTRLASALLSKKWVVRGVLLPAIGAAMLLGAAAASAQGLPAYMGASTDLPWSINQRTHSPNAGSRYSGQKRIDQSAALFSGGDRPHTEPRTESTAGIAAGRTAR